MIPFRNCELRKNDNNYYYSNSTNLEKAVGLGILVQFEYLQQPNLVVNKSTKLAQFNGSSSTRSSNYYKPYCNFLKTCSLCNKNLDPHEDVYMYRGDQGYCSLKCRNKQIENDEKRELEASTRKIIASFRKCHKYEPTETGLLLQDLRRQNNRIPNPPVVS